MAMMVIWSAAVVVATRMMIQTYGSFFCSAASCVAPFAAAAAGVVGGTLFVPVADAVAVAVAVFVILAVIPDG